LAPLLARLRAISTPIPEAVNESSKAAQSQTCVLPLDAPVTRAIFPSRTRWLEPLPRFVEAVRVCSGLDILMIADISGLVRWATCARRARGDIELLNTMRGANVEQLEALRTDISPLHRRCRRRVLDTRLQNCSSQPEEAMHESDSDSRLRSLVLSLTMLC
jgi:hypothetical protein